MIKQGLNKIYPDAQDFSLIHTFGYTPYDVAALPQSFSVYDGRTIPDQNHPDWRFTPPLSALPLGCTAESGTFAAGLEDGTDALYNPQDLYMNTPPYLPVDGRGIREMLKALIEHGLMSVDGRIGNKRTAYFNVYGTNAIDDFDAARIAMWVNKDEERCIIVGTYFYQNFYNLATSGNLPTPSFNTAEATLHCYVVTGWNEKGLEAIPWLGQDYGDNGKCYISREIYNGLMAQPYSGAFCITKLESTTPVPIGVVAWIDHAKYYFRNFFHI